jgi:peptidoglycan hydrolase CwlO-like protein
MLTELPRVEGRGSATIHDVTVSKITPPTVSTTSATLFALLARQKRVEKALARTLKSISSLETYLSSVSSEHLEVSKLKEVVQSYDSTAQELDEKVIKLEEEIEVIKEAILEEKNKLAGPSENEKLNLQAMIGVFVESEGEIKFALVYGARYYCSVLLR